MTFNLKKKIKIAQVPNINDQSSLYSYLQMLITQLNDANTLPTDDALSRITDMESLSQYGIQSFEELKDMVQQQMNILEQQENMQNNMVAPPQEPGTPVLLNLHFLTHHSLPQNSMLLVNLFLFLTNF